LQRFFELALRLSLDSVSLILVLATTGGAVVAADSPRERISLDENWRFAKDDLTNNTVNLLYDVRPQGTTRRQAPGADGNSSTNEPATATEGTNTTVLKQWILPTGNAFIKDPSRRSPR
jgi:beta-galactosidase